MVTITRVDATTWKVRIPVANGLPTDVVDWQLVEYFTNIILIDGGTIVDTLAVRPDIQFAVAPSGDTEYAIRVAEVGGDDGDFLGNEHGFETATTAPVWTLDGIPIALGIGGFATGENLSLAQSRTMQLPPLFMSGNPPTDSTVGTVDVVHEFSNILKIKHSQVPSPSLTWQIVDVAYAAMFPTSSPGGPPVPAFNRVRFDNGANLPVIQDGAQHNGPPGAQSVTMSSTLHPFTGTLMLAPLLTPAHPPYTGGPTIAGPTDNPAFQMIWIDRMGADGPKAYGAWVALPSNVPRPRSPFVPTAHCAYYVIART